MIEHYADRLIVNATAILSTVGLSVMSLLDVINGFLPTASLFITTFTTGVLAYYWIIKVRREKLEVQKLKKELNKE